MKKFLLAVLLAGLLVGRGPLAAAKDTPAAEGADTGLKPVAILSVTSYDRLISDIAFVGQVAQQPGLEKQAEGMVMFFAQGLNGLDKTRPVGLVVSTDGTSFPVLGFLPVTDIKQLLVSLQGVVAPAEDAGDGIYSLEKNNLKLYVKEQAGWAFIAQSTDALSDLPKDPSKLLGGLEKNFEIAVRFNIANVPEMYRTMAVDQLKEGIQFGLQQQPDEDESTFELRQKLIQNQMKTLEDVISEADQVTLGWSIDQEGKLTYLDLSMTALPGSSLAKKFAGVKSAPSAYSGFAIPKAALSLSFVQSIAKADAEQATAALDAFKATAQQEIEKSKDLPDDDTKAAAKEIVADLLAALKGTIASGKTDGGGSVLLGSKTLTAVAGIYIAEPGQIERALKKLSELSAKDANIPKIKFNADKHGDIRFHTAKFPVPAGEEVAKIVGSTLDVAVGIGPKSVYFGLGTDTLAAIKKAIDKSKTDASKAIAPGFVDLSMQSIIEFANAMEPNPMNKALAAELSKAPGKDHIQLVVKPVSNGVTYHLEAQEGVLKLIGAAVKTQTRAAGPPGGGGPAPPVRRVK